MLRLPDDLEDPPLDLLTLLLDPPLLLEKLDLRLEEPGEYEDLLEELPEEILEELLILLVLLLTDLELALLELVLTDLEDEGEVERVACRVEEVN